MKLVKNKKEIKIVDETTVNYTFLDQSSINIDSEWNIDTANRTTASTEKEIFKARSMGLKKSKIRHKNRIIGGQNKQGHSSVYE